MHEKLAALARERGGNFSIISAVLAVPLVLAVGVALDFSAISNKRSELQQAIDSAVLAIAREGKNVSQERASLIAANFLAGNFDKNTTTLKITRDGSRFSVSAETDAGLSFGALLGYQDWRVGAQASADIAYASYEIALVLDTTGSMKGGKLAAMKDAVLGLVDNMSKQVNDSDKLRFALVPFSAFVNVGPQYGPSFDKQGKQIPGTGAAWLDLAGASTFPQSELGPGASRFQIYHNLGQSWPGCVETRYAAGKAFDVDDTTPSPGKPETLFVPAFGIDEPDSGGFANSYIKSDAKPNDKAPGQKKKRWAKYGVKTDAAGNPLLGGLLDAVVAELVNLLQGKPGNTSIAIDSSGGKGPGMGCEVQPITPLTNDYGGLKSKVTALQAAGTTNIMEGVAWGNRVLSPGVPFSEGRERKGNLEKIMVVLTDGSNVFGNSSNELGSGYSSNGYLVDGRLGISAGGASSTNALMNARTLKACEAAKAAGITVYTIRLEEPNVATGTMLKECASSPDHYFDVPSRSQLDGVFDRINEKIVMVRIAS